MIQSTNLFPKPYPTNTLAKKDRFAESKTFSKTILRIIMEAFPVLKLWHTSFTNRILSQTCLPLMKPYWLLPTSLLLYKLSLSASTFMNSLGIELIILIGLKSDTNLGCAILEINAIKEEFKPAPECENSSKKDNILWQYFVL